jgi:hypothetical protein
MYSCPPHPPPTMWLRCAGGEARECSLALVLGVVHTVLVHHAPVPVPLHQAASLMDHMIASFAVHWLLRKELEDLKLQARGVSEPARKRQVDRVMDVLDAVARFCDGLAHSGQRDLSGLARECTQARAALTEFNKRCGQLVAAKHVLPSPEVLQSHVKAMVSAPSPRWGGSNRFLRAVTGSIVVGAGLSWVSTVDSAQWAGVVTRDVGRAVTHGVQCTRREHKTRICCLLRAARVFTQDHGA